MYKACVIGDSHAAALKLGWRQIESEFPDARLVWFAAHQALFDGLEVADGKLAATSKDLIERFEQTSRGLHVIDADYGLYLICGLDLAPRSIVRLRKEFWARHGGAIPVAVLKKEFPVAVEAELRKSQSARVLKMVRAITNAPIALIATPRPHEFEETEPTPSEGAVHRLRLLADAFESACRRIAEESGAIFLPQPAQTLSSDDPLSTQAVFAARSSDDPDRGHKNAAYGVIVLRDALGTMLPPTGPVRHAAR